ncbi:hypothetical protein [Mesonia aquimarina]|uniref:hypothetical protein n=1 Tax=Mesonia aquimarina TaxID=1504967 RepID=UPI000EF5E100|nr:hypothetical protein [Mesonia aquimarina]
MISSQAVHSFHIPVMGLAYTIDSPIRVAHYGISSVISIIDDELMEKMNALYAKKFNLPYQKVSIKEHDYRAKRITSYLNLVASIVKHKFSAFKKELIHSTKALEGFVAMLPNNSTIKARFSTFLKQGNVPKATVEAYLEKYLVPGAIDVNIMTKVDKDNFSKGKQLPVEFNDAHASLRGFAKSNLSSSVVLSAGMNPRLYSYFENFNDFFPDRNGRLKKKITLKVSDYRSAIIQGKFFAKKGLWVSEYRIESGLNCGGHAFATEGFLLGLILEEFKTKKEALLEETHEILVKALHQKGLPVPNKVLALKISVQGGVGTASEHAFLQEHYRVDSVGWGSPFLLVPEATSVDKETRALLVKAKEKDLYLSGISPLGVPFNTLTGTTNEYYKQKRIAAHKAGSSCPKKYLALSKEFGPEGVCTASKKYQTAKLQALAEKKEQVSAAQYKKEQTKINEKACLCVGLANASYMEHDLPIKGQAQGVVICPGPNMAYFDKEVSLVKMIQHIYGNASVLSPTARSHMFISELKMYVNYLRTEIETTSEEISAQQLKKWERFKANLMDGIAYYQQLFQPAQSSAYKQIQKELLEYKEELMSIAIPVLR